MLIPAHCSANEAHRGVQRVLVVAHEQPTQQAAPPTVSFDLSTQQATARCRFGGWPFPVCKAKEQGGLRCSHHAVKQLQSASAAKRR